MEIINVKIDKLKEYENNPRKNKKAIEVVTKSIRDYGFKNPIIIDENYVIVCGHTRLEAAKKLGYKEVPCIMADDLNEEQIKAFRLVDNKTAEYADWDYEKLEEELANIDIDLSEFGFDTSSIDIDDFFEEPQEEKEKEPKKVICPDCGREFYV